MLWLWTCAVRCVPVHVVHFFTLFLGARPHVSDDYQTSLLSRHRQKHVPTPTWHVGTFSCQNNMVPSSANSKLRARFICQKFKTIRAKKIQCSGNSAQGKFSYRKLHAKPRTAGCPGFVGAHDFLNICPARPVSWGT